MISVIRSKATPLNLLVALAVFIALAGLLADIGLVKKSGSIDLRHRVAATRHVMKGYDPYFNKKIYNDGKERIRFDEITATPAFWVLFYPIARLPYRMVRYVWLALSWFLLIVAIKIFAGSSGSQNKSKCIWFVSLLFVAGGYGCRLHMERGQIYTCYLFFLSIVFLCLQRRSKDMTFLGGFFIGLLASIRPTFAIMCVPALIYKRWKICAGSIAGAVFGIALSFIVTGKPILWKSYFDAQCQMTTLRSDTSYRGNPGCRYACQLTEMYPDMAPYNISINPPNSFVDSSIRRVFNYSLSPRAMFAACLIIMAVSIAGLFAHKMLSHRDISNSLIFLIGIWLVMISDHFIPWRLWSYYDVLWIAPLSAILTYADSPSFFIRPSTLVAAIILFFSIAFSWFANSVRCSEYLMLIYLPIIISVFLGMREGVDRNPATS